MTPKEIGNLKTNIEKTIEQCVLCGKLTGVCKDTPIGKRKYYVETAGQLCEECYSYVYARPHNDDILE